MLRLSWLLLFKPIMTQANVNKIDTQRIIFSADVVASACHIRVDTDGTQSNLLTFEAYRKSTGVPVSPSNFTVRLFESGASVQGCSAFSAGQIATLHFGNPGQLDAGGVVTQGAAQNVRIDVRAIDSQADFRGRIVAGQNSINYPVDFAAKGQFRFSAHPVMPDNVRAGEYNGALAFVVSYQ